MITATRRAIYGRLAGDTTLRNLLASAPSGYANSIFYDPAPETATYPFVVFSRSSGVPTESFGRPDVYNTDVWLVKAVDQNSTADTAEAIASRVQTLLNDAALSISGGNIMYLRRQSDLDMSELVNGELYRHVGSLFRLLVAPS